MVRRQNVKGSTGSRQKSSGTSTCKHGSHSSSGASGGCIDSSWFWIRVSHWLPLAAGARTALRRLGRTAAEAVVQGLEAEDDLAALFGCEVFSGLLPELRRLARVAPAAAIAAAGGSDRAMGAKTADNVACEGLRLLQNSTVHPWIALAQRLLMRPRLSSQHALVLFGSEESLEMLGEDVTERLSALPHGTLVWLQGSMAISNCFNKLVQQGKRMDGPWLLRKSGKASGGIFSSQRRMVLERFGQPSWLEVIDEYHAVRGLCMLPSVVATWSYIVNVQWSEQQHFSAGAASAVGEVLRSAADKSLDPIQKVSLPPRLAAAACTAIDQGDGSEEALLLQWSVCGHAHVPVRVAVYSSSHATGGPLRVIDEVQFTSHLAFAAPPATASCSL